MYISYGDGVSVLKSPLTNGAYRACSKEPPQLGGELEPVDNAARSDAQIRGPSAFSVEGPQGPP